MIREVSYVEISRVLTELDSRIKALETATPANPDVLAKIQASLDSILAKLEPPVDPPK